MPLPPFATLPTYREMVMCMELVMDFSTIFSLGMENSPS